MGVETVHYVLVGCKYNYNDIINFLPEEFLDIYDDDSYEEYYDKQKFYVIVDCMSSKYVFIGKIVEKSLEGFNPMCLVDFYKYRNNNYDDVYSFLQENKFPMNEEITTHVFTHYH